MVRIVDESRVRHLVLHHECTTSTPKEPLCKHDCHLLITSPSSPTANSFGSKLKQSVTQLKPSTPSPTPMAVRPETTIRFLTGTYTLNRTLSTSSQSLLKQQNVSFLVRQAVAYSNVTVTISQYTSPASPSDDGDKLHLDQTQSSTGGMKNTEERVMDWQWAETDNWIWGKVRGRGRYVRLEEIVGEAGLGEEDAQWLREGWEEGTGEVVQLVAESVGLKEGWTAWQVWGFAEVEGKRRQVRRIVGCRKGWRTERCWMVYDWKTPGS